MLLLCSIICFLSNWFSLFWREIYGCLWGGHNGSHLQETISLTHSDRLSQVYFGKQKARFISHKRVRWRWLAGLAGPGPVYGFLQLRPKKIYIIHIRRHQTKNHRDFQVSCFWLQRRFNYGNATENNTKKFCLIIFIYSSVYSTPRKQGCEGDIK
jgi:hypothetical protein